MAQDDKSKFDAMIENAEDAERPEGAGNTALAVYSDTPEFAGEDMLLPHLRLAQGLTAEVQDGSAKPGQWLISSFDPEEEVIVVPLGFRRIREHGSFQNEDLTPCPTPADETCPDSFWTGEGEKRTPPKCTLSYAYLCYSVTHDCLAAVRFSRTGLNAGKMVNTIVARNGLGKCAISLKATQRKGPKGTFYVPAVTPAKVEPAVMARAIDKARAGV